MITTFLKIIKKTLAESTLTGTVPLALKPGRLQNKASKREGGR